MKVAFVKPPIGGILGLEMLTFVEPLGMECVAGVLEPAGHECKILDLRIDGAELGMKKCKDFEPQVVGLQCNFTTERNRTVKLAREIKQQMPEAYVVVGGHDASRDPGWFTDEAIDAVAVGEGEEVMPRLLEALDEGKLDTAPGVVRNTKDGQRLNSGVVGRSELDDLPMPARHLIEEYADHYYINFRRPLALMETARGCPYRCNFCSVWKFHEKSFREKSPQRVVEELAAIKSPNIFITDDIFWMNVHRGREIARLIKEAGIKKFFTVQTRTDIIVRHPDLIQEWKECGNLAIFMGLEKIDDEGLKSVNKNNSAENNIKAIQILKDLDVGFTCNFIVDPAWGHEDFARLRDWVDMMGTYNSGFSVLTPLPGTDLWSEASENVNVTDWELFDIVHSVLPTNLPLADFYKEYARLWEWSLEVRYKNRGKMKTYLAMAAAVLTGKVTLDAMRKGMNIAKVFSNPATFMVGHDPEHQFS